MADSKRSDAPRAVVVGTVVRVRPDHRGGWRVRLAETGGALAAAEIRRSHPLPIPARGTRILLCGPISYDPDHDWYAVDPLDAWRPVYGGA